ncbi:uncharacterized protein LOC123886861 [Trifolium pratense]|uniref:uncharacterized protein LOC123886861 n=1 Tax=Trifolium pratense TaxID=57577 RepID=UPI001E690DE9|nr:uncharacterized protein LOC123886861 [Trifolium pratense]
MVAFLKSIDSRTWKAILTGWDHPKIKDAIGVDTEELKLEETWTTAEDTTTLGNSKALNALFNGVDQHMFKLIKKCTVAKEAWNILKTTYEGTAKVKISKLQMLTRKFENLSMKEDESIHDFYMTVMEYANEFDMLGEKLDDEKLVRKILRSLTKKFDMKVTAIEEVQDISSMKVDELLGSLQTYEASINERLEKKNKSIAFMSNADEEETDIDIDSTDSISEAIILLGRQFNKGPKKMDRRPKSNGKSFTQDTRKGSGIPRRPKLMTSLVKAKGFNAMNVKVMDNEGGVESAKQITALTGICAYETDSCEEELTYDELADSYRELCLKSEEVCRTLEKQKETISKLQTERCDNISKMNALHEKVNYLTSDFEEAKSVIDKLNTDNWRLRKFSDMLYKDDNHIEGLHKADDKLEEILEKNVLKPRHIGLSYEKVNKLKGYDPNLMYTQPKGTQTAKMFKQNLSYPKQHQGNISRRKTHHWVCHYCGRRGHIRPFCYKLYGYPERMSQPRPIPIQKKEWKPKSEDAEAIPKKNEVCLIAHTSLRVSSREYWYFDSGCSRHITGADKMLANLRSYSTSYVTFGGGAKGEIVGIGKLINKDLPKLDNVLLVKGLTANLISISQLCDQGMKVNFTQFECLVTDDRGDLVMRGSRSKDNCYLWVPQEETNLSTCLITKEDEVKLWHKKLGHLNLRSMKKAISEEAIRGIPKLNIEEGNICGDCQIGKQTRVPHQKLQHLTTTRVLELLHMDLMGPIQVESLGGKRYAYVVVDDFSRYTWINFSREKSETFDVFKDLCAQLQREKDNVVLRIRSDHGKEFENSKFSDFCASEGIVHEFSSPITPQQNGVAERKNRTLKESARVMLHAKKLPYMFWAEAMSTACYIHNRVTLRANTTTTLYELWKGKKPTVKHFHVFGSKCYILTDREPRKKLDPKSEEGIFLGYATNSKAYRVYNSITKTMMKSINVVVDDSTEDKTTDVGDDAIASDLPSVETVEVKESESESDIEASILEPTKTPKRGPSIRI